MMNITKNYGKLVGSVSAAMVDKARGILVELPKTYPMPQYKSQTSGLMCYPVEEALQAWSLSVDDDRLLLAMAAVASMADYVDGVGIAMPVTADVMAIMKFVAHLLDAEESGPVYMRHEVYPWQGTGVLLRRSCHLRFQSQNRNGFGSFLCCRSAEINKKKHKKN